MQEVEAMQFRKNSTNMYTGKLSNRNFHYETIRIQNVEVLKSRVFDICELRQCCGQAYVRNKYRKCRVQYFFHCFICLKVWPTSL